MPTYERADRERAMRGQTAFDGKCTARRHSDGKPCQRPAARGAVVCPSHGASAPQVKAAAKRRLDQAADVLVQRLLRFALDGETDDNTALRAIRGALDRAGLSARTAVSVAIAPKPWEQIFDDIAGGSRAESRARRGMPVDDEFDGWDTPALVRGNDAAPIVDAEVIEPEPDRTGLPAHWNAESAHRAVRRTYTLSDFKR